MLVATALLPFSTQVVHADAGERACELKYSNELKMPEKSLVTSVVNNVTYGSISYTTPFGQNGTLVMNPLPSYPYPYRQWPLTVILNEKTIVSLSYLQGKTVTELKAVRRDITCPLPPSFRSTPLASGWYVFAKIK